MIMNGFTVQGKKVLRNFCLLGEEIEGIKSGIDYDNDLEYNIQLIMEGQKLSRNIIVMYRIKTMIKRWMKMVKNSRQRYYILNEWVETQQSYIKSLQLMQYKIAQPLVQKEILTQYEASIVFLNIESMIGLGKEMVSIIRDIKNNFHPHTTVLSAPLDRLAKFFKIYRQYCSNYDKAEKIIDRIRKEPQFIAILKDISPHFYIEDYLIKPVNRPTKYKLLLTNYLNRLPKGHQDYEKLLNTIEIYHKLVEDINDAKNEVERTRKTVELDKHYQNIIESSRYLKDDFTAVQIYNEHKCKVYVFNDLLLIVRITDTLADDKLIMKMNIHEHSFVMRKQHSKEFTYHLFICGRFNSIHLMFQYQHQIERAYQIINSVIQNLYEKEFSRKKIITEVAQKHKSIDNRNSYKQKYSWIEQPVFTLDLKATVIAAEKRIYNQVEKSFFIIKYQLHKPQEIYQLCQIDIDTLKDIQKYYRRLYPDMVIPSVSNKPKKFVSDDYLYNFARYVEYRSISIQDFINFLLRQPQIAKRPEMLAYKLKISQFFWEYLCKQKISCMCLTCMKTEMIQSMKSYEKEKINIKKGKDPYCIMKSFYVQNMVAEFGLKYGIGKMKLQYKILWAYCKMRRIDYALENPIKIGEMFSFSVFIPWLSDSFQIKIPFANRNDTVGSIITYIAERQGFKTYRDLVLVADFYGNQYILDDDEYIWDIVKYMKDENEQTNKTDRQSTWLGKIFDWGEQFKMNEKTKIWIRKLIVFNKQTQKLACEENLEKYPLLVGELVMKYKKGLMILSITEVKLMCAFIYGIEEFNTIMHAKKLEVTQQRLKEYLPKEKRQLVNSSFVEDVVNEIQDKMRFCEKVTNLYKYLILEFGQKIGWVTTFLKLENLIPSSLRGGEKQVLLGINFKQVAIMVRSRSSNVGLLSFPITDCKYRIIGNRLYLYEEDRQFVFGGLNLTFFDKLFTIYKLIVSHS